MGSIDLRILAIILTAIGWLSRELWRRRQAKRQAASDAGKILSDKKKLLEELLSKTEDINDKNNLAAQLDEVNAVLLGLHAERLRRTLKDAGLPPEEMLVADGRSRLQPQQVTKLKEGVVKVKDLISLVSVHDLYVLGNAYYYMEQYEDAKNVYEKILNLKPNDLDILFNLGTTYGRLERYDEALAYFNRYLELRPNDPEALATRGLTYQCMERYDKSLVDLNHALDLRPDAPAALHNRGNTFAYLRRYDEALSDLNRSLDLRPDYLDTLNARGITYAELERYDEALADYNRALELRSDYPCTLYNLACLFSLRGKTDDALAYLEKAIGLDKKCREDAKTDEDFNNIRDDPRFKKLIGSD